MAKRKAAATRRKITELTRQKATAGKRRKLIWDTVQRGLALAIEPTGRQSWKFVYRWPPGAKGSKPVWLTWAGLGLADAREKAQETWKKIHDGIDPRGSRQASLQATMTFEDLHRRYVDQWARLHNRSWRQGEYLVRTHLIPAFGSTPAAEVSRADFRDVHQQLTQSGKKILANQVLVAGSAVFSWSIAQGVVELPANPAQGLMLNPTSRSKRYLSEAEIKAAWPMTFEHGAAGAALRLMLLTGQRGMDARLITPGHIEDGRWWNLPPGEYKTKFPHRVYLTDDALEAFASMKWGNVGSVAQREARMQKAARAISQKLKTTKWSPHALRHTVASGLARMEIGEKVISRVVGHAEGGGVTAGYIHHQYDNEKRRTMERWATELRRIREGRPADGEVVSIRA
jgi:integrase